jgi:hypothetical protein
MLPTTRSALPGVPSRSGGGMFLSWFWSIGGDAGEMSVPCACAGGGG